MNASTPPLLNPIRLMSALAAGSRNMRGRGLPGCARGVTVPTSIKPKPSAPSASIYAPSLSRPAASPTGLGNFTPITVRGRGATRPPMQPERPIACARLSWFSVKWCASSGSIENSSGRASGYRALSTVGIKRRTRKAAL